MVVGELQYSDSRSQDLIIISTKVQDLTSDAMADRMWRVEVADLQKYCV